jgi:hypothetical protein
MHQVQLNYTLNELKVAQLEVTNALGTVTYGDFVIGSSKNPAVLIIIIVILMILVIILTCFAKKKEKLCFAPKDSNSQLYIDAEAGCSKTPLIVVDNQEKIANDKTDGSSKPAQKPNNSTKMNHETDTTSPLLNEDNELKTPPSSMKSNKQNTPPL